MRLLFLIGFFCLNVLHASQFGNFSVPSRYRVCSVHYGNLVHSVPMNSPQLLLSKFANPNTKFLTRDIHAKDLETVIEEKNIYYIPIKKSDEKNELDYNKIRKSINTPDNVVYYNAGLLEIAEEVISSECCETSIYPILKLVFSRESAEAIIDLLSTINPIFGIVKGIYVWIKDENNPVFNAPQTYQLQKEENFSLDDLIRAAQPIRNK